MLTKFVALAWRLKLRLALQSPPSRAGDQSVEADFAVGRLATEVAATPAKSASTCWMHH